MKRFEYKLKIFRRILTFCFLIEKPQLPIKKQKSELQKIRRRTSYLKFKKRAKNKIPQQCWNCGISENLQIHHIVPLLEDISKAKDIKNVVMLCKKCHRQFHKDHDKKLKAKISA
jgi:5-methylcytosine-specific restriction endonuclease McrA